jgi:cytochrome c-type biogenesis protein CcmH
MNRREFTRRACTIAGGAAVLSAGAPVLLNALQVQPLPDRQEPTSPMSGLAMPASAYRPVRRPPKPGARVQLDEQAIEALERGMACPCPCTLDVYTCRTIDDSCGISPAVHRDVQRLVEGGYDAGEIMAAMTATYGDAIRMTSRRRGFELVAWSTPFAVLGAGGVAIAAMLRRWRHNSDVAQRHVESAAHAAPTVDNTGVSATPELLVRLDAALHDDSRDKRP